MDKYEYNIKADQIMKLIDRRDFKTAAKIADGIDWRRVRNINMLTNVGCVYQAVGRYADAKEIFQLARNRAPLGRRLVYQMADICIDAREFEEAERYIQEFSELAPKDTGRFELLYQLSRRKGEPIENQIAILEEFKKQDFDERWAFELAKLYHKAGYTQKCVAACDELILWFGEGQYVEKAMELKMLHAPLSQSQQEKYNMRLRQKQEEESDAMAKAQKEKEAASAAKAPVRNLDYSTDNLQAALTKSIQEIMEAEERRKTAYPAGLSYLEEYQSEQEEQEVMFAATRDLRREREKFKNMMTQPISSLITEMNMQKDSSLQDASMQQYMDEEREENFEEVEEETQRVFRATESAFDMLEEKSEVVPNVPEEKTEDVFRVPKESYHFEPTEEEIGLGGNSVGVWEETGTIFDSIRKKKSFQTEDTHTESPRFEEEAKEFLTEGKRKQSKLSKDTSEILEKSFEKEGFKEETEYAERFDAIEKSEPIEKLDDAIEEEKFDYTKKADITKEEKFGYIEESDGTEEESGYAEESNDIEEEESEYAEESGFMEEQFWGKDFYYQIPEMEEEKEEPEYVEVPFSLNKLDTNEIPAEIYYRVPDYDPQSYLDKAESKKVEKETVEKEIVEKEIVGNHISNKLSATHIEEQKEVFDSEEEQEVFDSEESEESFDLDESKEEEEDFDQEEEPDYEVFPEGGTAEEFYQFIMMRSYGVEEMPEEVYYQTAEYSEEQSEEQTNSESSEMETEDDSDYIYGIQMFPEDVYYEVPGYDPEGYLAGRAEYQGFEEEILGQQSQKRVSVQKNVSKKAESAKESERSSGKKAGSKSEVKQESIPVGSSKVELQEKTEEASYELPLELKNVFANYLHMPGVEQQIAEVLYETKQIDEESETSMSGNILLMGEVKSGKTTLAVSLIKTINRLNGRKGRKVAKISGDRLNNKGIKESINRLIGADLIIEHAGEMRISTITELLDAMGDYTGGMIVVLEDTRASLERLLADVPQIGVCFTHQIELKECNIAEWAETAKNYALENHYIVDDMAMLALSAKIDGIYATKKNIQMEDVQDIIDDAIEKAERRNKKLFGRLFSKKKDSDSVLLRESDFS